ncbi:hypothetical protein QNH36_12130 [Mesobacillus sp. AQ2]|uniref:hypothetical protein n=1 Tax=Bacillaceae TaxID=186817 RepID=UPI0011A03DB4|nr:MULTISPECIES: hypothetical protein [Bacillaceae]WHX38461.1 hypothetical protein QNH36_12130 [Mesobacillus sp. AQ2]
MDKTFEEYILSMNKRAVEYAKSFDKDFNYKEDNIEDLEEILDYYSNDLKSEMPTENQIYSMALIWGAYLGQMIKEHVNPALNWVNEDVFDDGEIIHLKSGENRIFPIDKVYKRLINGKEDNIISFYKVIKEEFNN